ncbi:MAG: hypothetical protein MPW15_03565 [Candidatus Manganitrophus sp.]|nr:hypothetical protein [Candidatus Manganitrophus sp.]
MRYFLDRVNLTTKLVLMMLLLTLLSLVASYVYNVRSEKEFIQKVEDNIEDLSTAIKISVEELTSTARTDEARLADYVGRLKNKGVKELSIISNEREVIASSNPKRVGVENYHQSRSEAQGSLHHGEDRGRAGSGRSPPGV